MIHFQPLDEARIPATLLGQGDAQIEIIPPAEHGSRLTFQVFCNGMPIGHARLEKLSVADESTNPVVNLIAAQRFPTYTLKMIQIAQNYRNRGIGTVLLKEILHYCRNHNIHRLTGEIKGELPALRQWYLQNGFSIVSDTWLEIRLH